MTDELLYHVDMDDNIIGSVTRSKAHQDPRLIHREIAIILTDYQSRVLLAQRSFKKKVFPGKWDLTCAGHVPFGMGADQAAHMELQEELGFDVPLYHIGIQVTKYDWETHLTHLYFGSYSGQEIIIQESEVEKVAVFNKEQVKRLGNQIGDEFRDLIKAALNGKLGQER
jgi:isopentenyl-diphosphate delta-isomerase